MLSEIEKNGIRSLLEQLSREDLISLTDTVTNRAVQVENCKDAIEAILSFTHSVKILLRRKKVRREHVFQYLAANQVFVPSTADKQQLIKKVMELWELKAKELKSDVDQYGDASVSSTSHDFRGGGGPVTSIEPASSTTSPGNSPSPTLYTDNYGQKYAQQWAPWFYDLLKQCGRNMVTPSQPHGMSDWGEHHFWADAVLNIQVTTHNENREEEYKGAMDVSRRLFSLVVRESIYLHPHLDPNGISGSKEGDKVTVVASGTVNRHSHYVGLFRQAFSLERDPSYNNNYRIRCTNLVLCNTDYLPAPYQT